MDQRSEWLDLLRSMATIAVIVYHCVMPTDLIETLVSFPFSWCVPVFVLITGALFLGTSKGDRLSDILRHNIFRILRIIVFWGGHL